MTRNGYNTYSFGYNQPAALGVHVLECGYIYKYRNLPRTMVNQRIFEYYGLVYIVQGEGAFESHSFPRKDVRAGNVFILFPGEWHYYRPLREENWKEYWITFTGDTIHSLMQQKLLNPEEPLFFAGKDESLIGLFKECFTLARQGTGNNPGKAGVCMLQILNQVISSRTEGAALPIDPIFKDILYRIRANPAARWDLKSLAKEQGVSYSQLRKNFYRITGIPPARYINRERIWHACDLLIKGKSLKDACWEIGMKDQSYFSRLFKKMMGETPLQYARAHLIS